MDTRHPGRLSNASSARSLMSRRIALQGAAATGAGLALLAARRSFAAPARAARAGAPPEWLSPDAARDRHGQVVLGDGPVYLSHLPFFLFTSPRFHPHRYQVIVAAMFPEEAMAAYPADRENAIAARLMAGNEAMANASHAGTGVALGSVIPIAAGREIFFEESRLLEDVFIGHSPIEIEVGFGFEAEPG